MENIQLAELKKGDHLESLSKNAISRVQLAKYAGASGDLNPLHLDDEFAQNIGLEGAIAHGMLIMGFLGEYVMKIANTQAKVANFKMRFGKMTFPGDDIECSGMVKDIFELNGKQNIELELFAKKDTGDVVGTGSATLQLKK